VLDVVAEKEISVPKVLADFVDGIIEDVEKVDDALVSYNLAHLRRKDATCFRKATGFDLVCTK
jgi:hypothetical protein